MCFWRHLTVKRLLHSDFFLVQQPQKADLLFFHPTKECLQFLYVTVIEVLQSVKDIDTVSFVPGTGKEFLRGYAEVFTDAQKFVH